MTRGIRTASSARSSINTLFRVVLLLTIVTVATPLLTQVLDLVGGLLAALIKDWKDEQRHPKIFFLKASNSFMNDLLFDEPLPQEKTTITITTTPKPTTEVKSTTTSFLRLPLLGLLLPRNDLQYLISNTTTTTTSTTTSTLLSIPRKYPQDPNTNDTPTPPPIPRKYPPHPITTTAPTPPPIPRKYPPHPITTTTPTPPPIPRKYPPHPITTTAPTPQPIPRKYQPHPITTTIPTPLPIPRKYPPHPITTTTPTLPPILQPRKNPLYPINTTTHTPIYNTPNPFPPNIRLDFRLMSKYQWQQFVEAVHYSMSQLVPGTPESVYNLFCGYHRASEAPAAHDGPAFLTWHSAFGHALDQALRAFNPSVTVPLFDTRPDTEIPNHCDACQYTAELLGNNDGVVNIGPFKNRQVFPYDCASTLAGPLLTRSCQPNSNYMLVDYNKFDRVLVNYQNYLDFCRPYNDHFEYNHNYLHVAMGGHMNLLTCAPNDPLFFLLHHFVHSHFDICMDKFSHRNQLQMTYPDLPDMPENHRGFDIAKPYNITLAEAFKKSMARNMKFILVPPNCDLDEECNPTKSDINAFWCKTRSRRCATKIRIGGVCVDKTMTYPDKACFKEAFCHTDPICSKGVCTCSLSNGSIIDEPPTVDLMNN